MMKGNKDRSVVIENGEMKVGKDVPQVKADMILVMPGVKFPKTKVEVNGKAQKQDHNGEVQRDTFKVNTDGKRPRLDGVLGKPAVVNDNVTVTSTTEGVRLAGTPDDVIAQLMRMGGGR